MLIDFYIWKVEGKFFAVKESPSGGVLRRKLRWYEYPLIFIIGYYNWD